MNKHTVDHSCYGSYSAIKTDNLLVHVTSWMNLKNIILRERSLTNDYESGGPFYKVRLFMSVKGPELVTYRVPRSGFYYLDSLDAIQCVLLLFIFPANRWLIQRRFRHNFKPFGKTTIFMKFNNKTDSKLVVLEHS